MTSILAIITVLGVSASGPIMAATTAPALAIAFWRNGIGALALAPSAIKAGGWRNIRPVHWRTMIFSGVALAAHFAAWISALKFTSVAAATALVSMQLLWVLMIESRLGNKVSRATVIGSVVALSGVIFVTGVDSQAGIEMLAGDLLAILGGLMAALYLIAGSRVRADVSSSVYNVIVFAVSATTLLIAALVFDQQLVGFSLTDWALILAVTFVAQILGHSIFNHLLNVMSPTLISLVLLLEVPGAALLAGWFLGQQLQLGVYVGLFAIVIGLAIVVVTRKPPKVAPID